MNPAFRPDGLKLYQTLVLRGSGRCNLQLGLGGGVNRPLDLMFLNSILLWSSGVQVGVIYIAKGWEGRSLFVYHIFNINHMVVLGNTLKFNCFQSQ